LEFAHCLSREANAACREETEVQRNLFPAAISLYVHESVIWNETLTFDRRE
jgi:hypothetical protein